LSKERYNCFLNIWLMGHKYDCDNPSYKLIPFSA